jgi:hypothetical protein
MTLLEIFVFQYTINDPELTNFWKAFYSGHFKAEISGKSAITRQQYI